ncbi:unnamed protein product [Lactuca virosa]|uniref:Uncharacterized protein n=1 Tax=Lactuca virosa TaxID=75947 RepID=A0AAU9NUR7_9ASTR|nr:unnamed protein product [Lactuca virosa]
MGRKEERRQEGSCTSGSLLIGGTSSTLILAEEERRSKANTRAAISNGPSSSIGRRVQVVKIDMSHRGGCSGAHFFCFFSRHRLWSRASGTMTEVGYLRLIFERTKGHMRGDYDLGFTGKSLTSGGAFLAETEKRRKFKRSVRKQKEAEEAIGSLGIKERRKEPKTKKDSVS